MTLSEKQHRFFRDLLKLGQQALCLGYEVSLKHTWRSAEEQYRLYKEGKSGLTGFGDSISRHQLGLAADIVLFRNLDDDPTLEPDWSFEAYEALGAYWKSLDVKNVWGGDWPGLRDAGHFERQP